MGQPNGKVVIVRKQNNNNDSDSDEEERPKIQQQIIFIQRQPNLIEINRSGVVLVQRGEYEAALERFIQVSKLNPNFPNIQQNIILCAILVKAQRIYILGIILFKSEEYEEALKRFEYIEENLKPDFRDCRELIDECRKRIWMNNPQIQALEAMRMIEQVSQFFELMVRLSQLKKQQNNDDDDDEDDDDDDVKIKPIKMGEDKDEQPNFNKQINAVYVFYTCNKKPQCNNYVQNRKFTHSKCNQLAILNTDGMICCESNCQPYFIGDAYFSCCGNRVCSKATIQMNGEKYEVIKDPQNLADCIEDCLSHINVKEDQKMDFRQKVAGNAFIKLLKY